MKKKKQKKTDAAGKYTRPAAGPGGSGPGISSGPYGGAQQLPALQTIPFQPLQIQQEPMQPLPLAPGCERGASRGTKERTPADPAGICGAPFERSENGGASMPGPGGAGNWAGRFCKAKFCCETKRPRPCGNTDEAKEVEIAISTKNIPCAYKKHKGEAGRRCG